MLPPETSQYSEHKANHTFLLKHIIDMNTSGSRVTAGTQIYVEKERYKT